MSKYGHLHDDLRKVRDRLASLLPGVDTSSYLKALESSSDLQTKIGRLLREWRQIEMKMSASDG